MLKPKISWFAAKISKVSIVKMKQMPDLSPETCVGTRDKPDFVIEAGLS
jgi:hypothetical protein